MKFIGFLDGDYTWGTYSLALVALFIGAVASIFYTKPVYPFKLYYVGGWFFVFLLFYIPYVIVLNSEEYSALGKTANGK